MFDSLQQKLESAFRSIRGRGSLSDNDIAEAMRGVRMALLEADVNFKVAKDFCDSIAAGAAGEEVHKSLTPDQQVIRLVHEALTKMMGDAATPITTNVAPPIVIMLVGLQGSGKTTSAAKLALYLKNELKKRALLVPADVYRPAAIEQLKRLASQLQITAYDTPPDGDPVAIAKAAYEHAKNHAFNAMIIDTAGRLQIDTELMAELSEISDAVQPHEILLVADAMTGQEAVNVAQGFDQTLEIDGLILTKLDGDARGGAALSMRAVTGKPIKFIGVGEKLDALEVFHPERMASRILGMGDVLTLIDKAVKEVDQEESLRLAKKMAKNEFSLTDFLGQLRMIRKMGSVAGLASMIPGMGKLARQVDPEQAEKELTRVEAIILSMTPKEREDPQVINGSRRLRISQGSGTRVEDVNKLLKQFTEMRKMMKQLTKSGLGGLLSGTGGKGLGGLGNIMKNLR